MGRQCRDYSGSFQTLYWLVVIIIVKPFQIISGYVLRDTRLILLVCGIFLSGCTAGSLQNARKAYYNGMPDQAAQLLAEEGILKGRDRLLFYMENGIVLHYLGRYEESTHELLAAAELISQQEVISASSQVGSLVVNDWVMSYEGEYSERLWVHTYLMMNFFLEDAYEDALVEAKKALEVLKEYPDALKNDYYTQMLIGIAYESLNEENDAYIEYKKLAERLADPEVLSPDLFRLSHRLGFDDDAKTYASGLSESQQKFLASGYPAELILFVAQGRAPKKLESSIVIPPSIRFSFPKYENRRMSGIQRIKLIDAPPANPQNASDKQAPYPPTLKITTNLGDVSRDALKARAVTLIAKEAARAAAKEAIAQSLEHKNKGVIGDLVRILFFVMEQADTRCWQTLPEALTVIRVPLEPGAYHLALQFSNEFGVNPPPIPIAPFAVRTGAKVFRSVRLNPASLPY